jgi:hypothetical protein
MDWVEALAALPGNATSGVAKGIQRPASRTFKACSRPSFEKPVSRAATLIGSEVPSLWSFSWQGHPRIKLRGCWATASQLSKSTMIRGSPPDRINWKMWFGNRGRSVEDHVQKKITHRKPNRTAYELAGAGGLEPPPSSLTVRCPTDWTTPQLGWPYKFTRIRALR